MNGGFPHQGGLDGYGGHCAVAANAQAQHRGEARTPAQGAEASQGEGIAGSQLVIAASTVRPA
jgi:hypothetical protein